jgi:hypothetical protein
MAAICFNKEGTIAPMINYSTSTNNTRVKRLQSLLAYEVHKKCCRIRIRSDGHHFSGPGPDLFDTEIRKNFTSLYVKADQSVVNPVRISLEKL